MKLFELIEKGIKLVPDQTYYQFFEYNDDDNICGACPIGMAYIAAFDKHGKNITSSQITQELISKYPELMNTKIKYCHKCGIRVSDIFSYAIHLNDDHEFIIPEIIEILRGVEE